MSTRTDLLESTRTGKSPPSIPLHETSLHKDVQHNCHPNAGVLPFLARGSLHPVKLQPSLQGGPRDVDTARLAPV